MSGNTIWRRCTGFATRGRAAVVVLVAAAAAFAVVSPAFADPPPSSSQTITGSVVIPASISLAMTTTSFTLTGAPGTTQTVTLPGNSVVTTNDQAGYLLYTYPPLSNVFTGGSVTFPTSDLSLNAETGLDACMVPGAPGYVPLGNNTGTAAAPNGGTLTGCSATVSATTGDAWDNDYQMTIPTVAAGTYTAALLEIAWGR
jgi:hypothetical protein